MQLSSYLHFNGTCEEAFTLYHKVLGGEIAMMFKYEGSPAASMVPAEWKDKVLHVTLRIGDKQLLGSDSPPEYFKQPQGMAVCISVDSPAEVDRIFNAFAEGGQVGMPVEKTFFAESFGMVTDRYGIPWMIICPASGMGGA